MPQQPLVEFVNISKSFGNRLLVDNVSFALNQGQITTLIGQNGAGKTTIARIILGLEDITKGKLVIRNGLKVAYVPQKLDFNCSMPLTGKALMKVLAPRGLDKDVLNLIEFVDFNALEKMDIAELSGGQLQKLVLASTLANKADLVILDEPAQYLDLNSQQQFYRNLNQIKNSTGLTIFMISHDLFTVMKNSDQVICINGHVCCIGKPKDANQNIDFKNALSEIGLYVHLHDHNH